LLTRVFAPARRTVWTLDGARQLMKNHLANTRAHPQRGPRWSDVRQFEGNLALEPWVDKPGSRVNEDRQPADAATPFDSSDEVRRDAYPLESCSERKLTRRKHEVLSFSDLFDRLGCLDPAAKHASQPKVDAGRLKLQLYIGKRLDDDRLARQTLPNVPIG
jgi:hypothetical protein